MSLDDWQQSIRPKVQGTWNLHHALNGELDFFLLFSSIVGILGNASQAAYASASTFMDAFAEYRNGLGLPATAIDIGVVLGVGFVAENERYRQSLERQGYDNITETELMALMEAAFTKDVRGKARGSIITGLRTWKEGETRPTFLAPRFSHFRRLALESKQQARDASATGTSVREALANAPTIRDATAVVCDAMRAKLAGLLLVALKDISPEKTMHEYGLDSLVAVEMRNWISSSLGATVPILEMLGNTSILSLSASITRKSTLVKFEVSEKERP